MAQMPDIKPEVNKEPEREKKGAGFLASLFGGARGAGGLGGAAAGGGLLATKAGLLTLIVAGSTVAGGIGLVGYQVFGPGQESGDSGLSLFQSRPRDEASAQGAGGAAAAPDAGRSESLQNFASANAGQAASDAPVDATAAGAASGGSSASAGSSSAGNVNSIAPGNGVNRKLQPGKFGALSKEGGGGSGGSGASASVAAPSRAAPDAAAAAAQHGTLTASRRGASAIGATRGVAGRVRSSNGALRQALGARQDNVGAASSYAAGRTYDGGAASVGNNGIGGSDIGMAGPGAGGEAQPTTMPNSAQQTKELEPPPTPNAVSAAPWQNAITTAQVLLGIALALMYVAKLIRNSYSYMLPYIAGVMAALGLVVVGLGAQIAMGKYGQTLQGGLLAAAGAGVIAMSAALFMEGDDFAAEGASGADAGVLGITNPFILVGGGVALVGLAATMLMPPKEYPSERFGGGNPPDINWFGS